MIIIILYLSSSIVLIPLNAGGVEQMLQQIIYIKLYRVNNPNWPGGGD